MLFFIIPFLLFSITKLEDIKISSYSVKRYSIGFDSDSVYIAVKENHLYYQISTQKIFSLNDITKIKSFGSSFYPIAYLNSNKNIETLYYDNSQLYQGLNTNTNNINTLTLSPSNSCTKLVQMARYKTTHCLILLTNLC